MKKEKEDSNIKEQQGNIFKLNHINKHLNYKLSNYLN